jgi:Anti-sigma factor NepR
MMSNDQSEKSSKGGGAPSGAKKATAGKEDWIGAHLRKVYDEALNEPVPDRFLDLLKEIDKKESGA